MGDTDENLQQLLAAYIEKKNAALLAGEANQAAKAASSAAQSASEAANVDKEAARAALLAEIGNS